MAGASCFLFLSFSLSSMVLAGRQGRPLVINDIAVDIPTDGGLLLMGSRMWRMNRVVDIGFLGGGGQINRNFDLKTTAGDTLNADTKAIVFPFLGPQVSFNFNWIGLSLGYAAFWAKTDLTVQGGSLGTLTGTTKGWGSGFYSPLLVLDFYDTKHDLIFGFGLGGFLGTSYPKLAAHSTTTSLTTDESPIDTLTFHLRLSWTDGRAKRLKDKRDKEEDF